MQVKGKVRQRFTKEEDQMILLLVKQLGENNWDEVAKQLHNRTKRQCRERWLYHLNPKLNSAPWTKEEDELLLRLHKEFGSNWTVMSKYFNRRPNCSLKNRFFVLNYKEGRIGDLINGKPASTANKKPFNQISKSNSVAQVAPTSTIPANMPNISTVQSCDRNMFPNRDFIGNNLTNNQIAQYSVPPPLPLPPIPPPKLRSVYYSSSTPSEPASFGEMENKDISKKDNKSNEIGMEVMRREDLPSIMNIFSIQSLLV